MKWFNEPFSDKVNILQISNNTSVFLINNYLFQPLDTISLRIKELITVKNMSISAFEKKIGVGNNSIGTIITRNSNVSGAILSKILISFPEICPDWLLTGRSDMFRSEFTQKEDSTSTDPKTKLLEEQVALLKENKIQTREMLELYKENLQNCKNEILILKQTLQELQTNKKTT
jgi:hypothetical protein